MTSMVALVSSNIKNKKIEVRVSHTCLVIYIINDADVNKKISNKKKLDVTLDELKQIENNFRYFLTGSWNETNRSKETREYMQNVL